MDIMLKGKKVLITSGGTLEKWDNVRGHTNLSKGMMGCYLAEAALAAGAEVIYMHGYFAKLPNGKEHMRIVPFEGIVDLGDKLKDIVQAEKVDVVIMAVAGSDWLVDKVFDPQGNEIMDKGKMPSDEPPTIKFKKAPKILSQIKTWAPNTTLVGFKLEATDDVNELLGRAKIRMESSNATLMVANSSKSLYGGGEPHFILFKDGNFKQTDGKQGTALELIEILSRI